MSSVTKNLIFKINSEEEKNVIKKGLKKVIKICKIFFSYRNRVRLWLGIIINYNVQK